MRRRRYLSRSEAGEKQKRKYKYLKSLFLVLSENREGQAILGLSWGYPGAILRGYIINIISEREGKLTRTLPGG